MSARPTLLFLHGWGFDARYWLPLQTALAALTDWPQRAVDRGYFGLGKPNGQVMAGTAVPELSQHSADNEVEADANDDVADNDTDKDDVIVIGHSFGFLNGLASFASTTETRRPKALVSINGFARFSATDDFREGVSPRMIERMIAKLRDAPGAVVDDFRQRCGWQTVPEDVPLSTMDVERLTHDLQALRHDDARDAYRAFSQNLKVPILVLAGKQDVIVPPAMTQATFFDQTIVWRDGGDHLLPTSATDWCAQQICVFLESIPAGVAP